MKVLGDGVRVYFSVCGLGFGHVFRMLSVAKALDSRVEVLFSAYGEAVKVVREMGFRCVSVPSVELEMGRDSTVLSSRVAAGIPRKFFVFLRQLGREIKVLKCFKPDVVVSDSRLSTVIACWLLGFPCILVANQLNIVLPLGSGFWVGWRRRLAEGFVAFIMAKLWGRASKIFVPDFPFPFTISAKNVMGVLRFLNGSVKFIGPILFDDMFVGDVNCVEARERMGLPLDKKIVYVSISGGPSERFVFFKLFLDVLREVNDSDLYFVVSLGVFNRVGRKVLFGENFEVWDWLPDRRDVLIACDLVVCRGGHNTILEALCFNKPLILVPTPGHTEKICNSLKAATLGVAEVISQSDFNASVFRNVARDLLLSNSFRSFRVKGFRKKLNGLKHLVEEISLSKLKAH